MFKQFNLVRAIKAGAAMAILVLAAGCAERDYPRGQFQGYVLGGTQEEIIDKVGKPVSIDAADPSKPVLIYEKKTFDVDNYNKPDARTRVFMEKKPDGKTVAVDVVFG